MPTVPKLYETYFSLWKKHVASYGETTALLYQVGAFFELYDLEHLDTGRAEANVRRIADICQLSLNEELVGGDKQKLFGGFPEHQLAKFERILVHAGYTVVVYVQKKGSSGDVEDRVVDHISSPGCFTDTAGTAPDRFLVGICLESAAEGTAAAALKAFCWAAVALNLSTGQIRVAEGGDRDRLHQFLCLHPPSELVLYTDGGDGATHIVGCLKSGFTVATHIQCLPALSAALEMDTLQKWWPGARLRLEWVSRMPLARRSLACLMRFAADHVPSALAQLAVPEVWVPLREVRLGNAALEQLAVVSMRDCGGGSGSKSNRQSLLDLMSQTRSTCGRRLLRQRLMRPITDITELNRRLDMVDHCRGLKSDAAEIERGLRGLYDMSRIWRRVELGVAGPNDMACLLRSWLACVRLVAAASSDGTATAAVATLQSILSEWNLDALIAIAQTGAAVPSEALPIKNVNDETAALFEEGRSLRTEAVALCDSWSALATLALGTKKGGASETLCLSDAEGGGFRITGTKRRVNAAWTQLRDGGDLTATTTAYKSAATLETDALAAISSRHRSWMGRWAAHWQQIWNATLESIVTRARDAHRFMEGWVAELDVAWTSADIADTWLWKRPELVSDERGWIEVDHLRHPILERVLQSGVAYVPHTLNLHYSDKNGLLLYGMNASGKSSLMKAVGLAVLLAQSGFPVPAAQMRLAPYSALFTRILGNDDLWAGLSSFAVEMTEFREVLRFADARTLVLGDELCSGTETLSATALVAAGIETLAGRGSSFVFATHLHELATLPAVATLSQVRTAHLQVRYDATADRLIYDRSLAEGSGSALYGLEVCRALDLPVSFMDRAMSLRKELDGVTAPRVSRYSAKVVMSACAVCGSAAGLEAHHITPQKEAATAAAGKGYDIHAAGNLVCLCAACHDDHHAGRLQIQGWEEVAGANRTLVWSRSAAADVPPPPDVSEWVREQKRSRIKSATIRRLAAQLFGANLTDADIRAIKI